MMRVHRLLNLVVQLFDCGVIVLADTTDSDTREITFTATDFYRLQHHTSDALLALFDAAPHPQEIELGADDLLDMIAQLRDKRTGLNIRTIVRGVSR